MAEYWVASGDLQSWYEGLDYMRRQGKHKQIVWAVREDTGKRAKEIDKDDLVAFWATDPVKGIVGFGRVVKIVPNRDYPIYSGDQEDLEKNGKVYSPFTVEMEILWLAHPYPWLCLERIRDWITPYVQAGLNRIVEPENVQNWKRLFDLTMLCQEMTCRGNL